MDLYAEFTRVIGKLNAEAIRYAVAGRLAVSVYTEPRAAVGIDLLIAVEDVERAILAVSPIGFHIAGRPADVGRRWLRIQRLVKAEGADLVPLNLLIPVDAGLARLLDDRMVTNWLGTPAAVVSARALRILKRLRGSTQDQADLEAMGPEGLTQQLDFDRVLRTVSQRRRLCLRLPHIATPAEQRLLARFDEIVVSVASVTDDDVPAIMAGWRAWWRAERTADIAMMAQALPPDLVDADRELAMYAVAAGSACR